MELSVSTLGRNNYDNLGGLKKEETILGKEIGMRGEVYPAEVNCEHCSFLNQTLLGVFVSY